MNTVYKKINNLFSKDESYRNTEKKISINLKKIMNSRDILKENVKNTISFSKPILRINDQPLFYPKTINVIQGKSGANKSRLAEHICSILLKNPESNIALLGLQSSDINTSVCYVDSERNLSEQYPYSLQQIKINAGYKIEDEISCLDFISLIEIDRAQRFRAFNEYLEMIRQTHKGHIFVILDVLTDLVDNFNDPKSSLQLIDLLNRSINTYNITFLCIIHENPNQDKARGHLGTELINKSSTALSINYTKDYKGNDLDIIKIQFLKCRSSKRIDPIFVKFSEEKHNLIFANNSEIEQAKHSKEVKANLFDLSKFIIDNVKVKILKRDLLQLLMEKYDCTPRTIETRIKSIQDEGLLKDLGYELVSTKQSKQVLFELKKIVPNIQQTIFE